MTHRLPERPGLTPPDDPPGECGWCNNTGRVKCGDCEGNGYTKCPACRGRSGNSERECAACDDSGGWLCLTCAGDGWLTCDACETCDVCGGLIRDGSHRRCRSAED